MVKLWDEHHCCELRELTDLLTCTFRPFVPYRLAFISLTDELRIVPRRQQEPLFHNPTVQKVGLRLVG